MDKEKVIQHKKRAIRKINNMLEDYIKTDNDKHIKKVDLIAYWLETYSDYIRNEDIYDPTRIIRYKRGNVIRVNFGFNVGAELGGLHYAVVLDNDNKHSANVVTVIPLSSTDGKNVHERSVFLGPELYEKIYARQMKLLKKATEDKDELNKNADLIANTINKLYNENDSLDDETLKNLNTIKDQYITKINDLEKSISIIEKNQVEISRLKLGSMALTNQITTISKQRIYSPKKSVDLLYGISLSSVAMDKIDAMIKKLYIFS